MPKTNRGQHPKHIENQIANMAEVTRLLEIHRELGGQNRGPRHGLAVLNNSCVVLLVACWEAFIKDIVSSAFDIMLEHSKNPYDFPTGVRVLASKEIKFEKDETLIWKLAGDGWQDVMGDHKKAILDQYCYLSSPKSENIDKLVKNLLGIHKLSKCWGWSFMPSARSVIKLDELVTLRGDIAHRVQASQTVYKNDVRDHIHFIYRLSVSSHNYISKYLNQLLHKDVWFSKYTYSPIKLP